MTISLFTLGMRLDDSLLGFPLEKEYLERTYANPDNDPRGPWTTSDLSANHVGPHFPIKNPDTEEVFYPPEGRYWVFSEDEVKKRIKAGRIIFGKSGTARPVQKVFLNERESLRRKAESWWDEHGLNSDGTQELKELLSAKIFDHSKPSITLKHICNIATSNSDIILDFFAGSGTIMQAVFSLNREDNENRRVIAVQFPEPTRKNTIAYNQGFSNIADIAKERVRRVIEQMKTADPNRTPVNNSEDLGFKVFKLAKSNMRMWTGVKDAETAEYLQQMALFTDPLVEGWGVQNVIYEIAIREGYSLNVSIEPVDLEMDNTIYRVSDPDKEQYFFICLDNRISPDPTYTLNLTKTDLFICRDVALDDTTAANIALNCRLKTI